MWVISDMVEAALLIERKTFEEMVRFVMKAMKEGFLRRKYGRPLR